MEKKSQFTYSKNVFRMPILLIFLMWLVYWVEIKWGVNYLNYGLYPRTFVGLRGILFSPFIHASISHLINNTIPIFIFTAILFYFYREIAFRVLFIGWFFTGLFTWLIGVSAHHIGMSGLVYLLFGFVFFSGVLRKYYRLIAVSLVVIFLYGSMFWYVFPIKDGVSWEGHLSGLSVGFVLAVLYRKIGPQKAAYIFKKDAFDLLFDEEGNFNPPSKEEDV